MKAETREEIQGCILWLESLRDCIEDGETEAALEAVDALLSQYRKQAANTRRMEFEL